MPYLDGSPSPGDENPTLAAIKAKQDKKGITIPADEPEEMIAALLNAIYEDSGRMIMRLDMAWSFIPVDGKQVGGVSRVEARSTFGIGESKIA